MTVTEHSQQGVSSFTVPIGQLANAERDVWLLEFAHPTKEGVNSYKNGAFDRKRGVGDERDLRWVIDLESEEFYDRALQTNTSQLGLVLRVASGEFYTNAKSRPLLRRKGDGTYEYFGSAAEEVGADVFWRNGDAVLRSEKTGAEIFRLKDKPGTTYEITVENTPVVHPHVAWSLSHFQYYYGLIVEPMAERYEFSLLSGAVSSAGATSRQMASFARASYVASPAPDPALCGAVILGKRTKPLRP